MLIEKYLGVYDKGRVQTWVDEPLSRSGDRGLALCVLSWLCALMADIKRVKQWPNTLLAMTIIAKCFWLPKQNLEAESARR